MQLTKKFVKAKNPCAGGYKWFLRDHNGQGDYQAVLDALVADGRVGDACWLLDQFGPTDAVLRLDTLDATAIVFAGTLEVRMGINVDTVVRAGRSLITGGGIRAGESIVAGENINAGGNIASGGNLRAGGDVAADWGIEIATRLDCGGNVRAKWDICAGQDLAVTGHLHAGQDINTQGAIKCGQGIKAGGGVTAEQEINAGCGIQAGGSIQSGEHLACGWGLIAGEDIRAEGAIRAGEGAQAAGVIEAGAGHGVYAGLSVRLDAWDLCARVIAQARPAQLVSGHWAGPDGATSAGAAPADPPWNGWMDVGATKRDGYAGGPQG
ncbi:FapA family protein [Achromobacter insolitus]|uniref:FapA family protein n=1 Tax=Achromobacter insolitus TaxID=217204 RepID=UPI001CD6A97D|nr:FapA family protein [Achromobacter insolitus]